MINIQDFDNNEVQIFIYIWKWFYTKDHYLLEHIICGTITKEDNHNIEEENI